jgi:protein-S-isoprenylcysteine O-methyltransferase Ste14
LYDGRIAVALFLKNLFFTLIMPGTVGVYAPLFIATHVETAAPGIMRYFAPVLLLLGLAVYLWCIWDFATFGRGTPFPADAPKHLVVRGLYRYVRNPMYIGMLLVIGGWVVYFDTMWLRLYYGAILLMFHLFVVVYEEPKLGKLFGEEYTDYCRRVGRWIPRGKVGD